MSVDYQLKQWFEYLVEDQKLQENTKLQRKTDEKSGGTGNNYYYGYSYNNPVNSLTNQNKPSSQISMGSFVQRKISQQQQKAQVDKIMLKTLRSQKKQLDVRGAISALFGLSVCLIEFEYYLSSEYKSNLLNDVLRSIVYLNNDCLSTLYTFKERINQLPNQTRDRLDIKTVEIYSINIIAYIVQQTNVFRLMWVEILINIIHCPPKIDEQFWVTNEEKNIQLSLNGCFMCVMLLRLYHISKLFAHYSKWLSDFAQEQAEQENCEANITFAIKAVLKEKPIQTMSFLMIISDMAFALAVRHFELAFYKDVEKGPNNNYQDYSQIINAMWLIMITMMTVGFGDYRPKTYPGRTICIIACFWGVLIVSMMVVTLTNATTLAKKETRAYAILHRLNLKHKIRQQASIVLTRLIRLNLTHQKLKKSIIGLKEYKLRRLTLQNELMTALQYFRDERSNLYENELTADEILRQITEQMDRDLNQIKKAIRRISSLKDSLQELEASQDISLTTLNEVIKLSKFLDDVLMKFRFNKL